MCVKNVYLSTRTTKKIFRNNQNAETFPTWCMGEHPEVLKQPRLDLVHVLGRVLVSHVGGGDVELKVGPEVLEVVVVGQLVGDLNAEGHGSLVGPASWDRKFPFHF